MLMFRLLKGILPGFENEKYRQEFETPAFIVWPIRRRFLCYCEGAYETLQVKALDLCLAAACER